MSLAEKLKPKIIDRRKGEFRDCPPALEGEVLLERVYTKNGEFAGWITATVETVDRFIQMALDPAKRPPELQNLSKEEFLKRSGWLKYFLKWKQEGIDLGVV